MSIAFNLVEEGGEAQGRMESQKQNIESKEALVMGKQKWKWVSGRRLRP